MLELIYAIFAQISILENKGFIGIELSEDYINIAKSRIENAITKIE
jgi:DNA modification methylase